jgi:hypothetical protein
VIHTPLPPSALARAQLSSMREIGREPGYARERPERPQARGARARKTRDVETRVVGRVRS